MARIVTAFELHSFVGDCHFDAELLRLVEGSAHQGHSRNSGRKAEVILDARRSSGLAAERAAVDGQYRQALGRGIDRCRQASRAGADHNSVIESIGVERPDQADAPSELVLAWIAQQ